MLHKMQHFKDLRFNAVKVDRKDKNRYSPYEVEETLSDSSGEGDKSGTESKAHDTRAFSGKST